MKEPTNVAQILWMAGAQSTDQLTLASETITHTLFSGCHFSDWDELVFVMSVKKEDEVKTKHFQTAVEGFEKAAPQGSVWITSGPEREYRDSHRPWLEPEFGPSMLATRISYVSDTEFKFLNVAPGYGLLRVLGVREVAEVNSERTLRSGTSG